MHETSLFLLLMVCSVFVSSVSQLLLKKSALKKYPTKLREYLNPLVVTAYTLFFGSTVVTVIAYRHVALSMGPVVESLGYVFIAVLSYFFLREKLSRRKILGYVLIVAGVCLTAL